MFKCQNCKQTSKANEKQNKKVIETRQMLYYAMERTSDEQGNELVTQGKLQGQGFETVKEVNVCNNCLGSN